MTEFEAQKDEEIGILFLERKEALIKFIIVKDEHVIFKRGYIIIY